MNIFKKIFGTQSENENQEKIDNKSQFLPDEILPVDELFTFKFRENGGKFIYCVNINEVHENFENILEENDWFERDVCCFDSRLYNFLEENKLNFTDIQNPSFFFTSCENLIADEGSILFSSKQLKQFKIDELPANVVVFASTSQILMSKGDGLRSIKSKYDKEYPTNITAIKYFEKTSEDDFLNYGSCHKNLYLLLLEDL
ncbi:lactate utilization protein B/C [Flavobacterium sp. 20NA77.7]|uniref:Lactate utilization protein B/C n=1 Tax=Flavobacterium nakdongensis TaxID=3073563 RepID=A0ABY9RBC1_9FLAO|nr:lactate utilization protein B/C [Flavobacterium sp. 20NA77.7]WMW78449.1 lactate utilization protein B/C [Flavobacterium sp. 20NA77.7]